jgi:hypothetical protein
MGILLVLGSMFACDQPGTRAPVPPPTRDKVTWLAPRCAGVQSCLYGRVTASESAAPLARAAVFLQQQPASGHDAIPGEGIRLQALTDEEGVFTVENPPPGRYRIAVFKGARSAELKGVELGGEGTTLVPVSMAPN